MWSYDSGLKIQANVCDLSGSELVWRYKSSFERDYRKNFWLASIDTADKMGPRIEGDLKAG